jgi:hypothetical protein
MMLLNPKKMYSKVAKRAGNVAKILPKLAGNFNELAILVPRGLETEVNIAFVGILPGIFSFQSQRLLTKILKLK